MIHFGKADVFEVKILDSLRSFIGCEFTVLKCSQKCFQFLYVHLQQYTVRNARRIAWARIAQGSTLFSGCFVWVSRIVCLADRKERSTKSHESTTKQKFGLCRILNLSSHCLILSRNRPERVSDFGVRSSKLSAFFTRTFQYDSWHRMGC